MRHLLLGMTVFLTLTVAQGQTDVYHPFPDSNAFWNQHSYSLNFNHTCSTDDYYALFINGDTIIGTNTYHKIYRQGYTVYACWNPPTTPVYSYYSAHYDCAIRQDSLQKKVFHYYNYYPSKDTILYDFNLNVGDTVPLTYAGSYFETVSKVDSALVGTKYHKKFTLQGSFPDTL